MEIIGAEDKTAETPDPAKEAEDAKRQDAVARGDILDTDADLDADILAEIAGDIEEEVAEPEREDNKPVPKARFNDVNNKAKLATEENERLKKELEELRAGKPADSGPTAEQKIETERLAAEAEAKNPTTVAGMEAKRDALQEQADILLVEAGPQDEERKAILRELNTLNKNIAKAEINAETQAASQQATTKQELSGVVAESYEIYPFLDNTSDKCDADAVLAVRTRRFELEGQGVKPAEALRQAVDEKGPKFAKMLGFVVDNKKQADAKTAREQAALKVASETSLRQPATPPAKGEKEALSIDVSKLSDKQYSQLPEHERAKLRGDIL